MTTLREVARASGVSISTASRALSDHQYAGIGDGARVEVTLDNGPLTTLHLRAGDKQFQPTLQTPADATIGGTVPATLALTLGAPASFGAFTPGIDKEYTAATTANVVSTAADTALTVSDPGHLTNGAFALSDPLRVDIAPATWSTPVSNAAAAITFKQHVTATDALRTGAYAKTLTFTLSTTNP